MSYFDGNHWFYLSQAQADERYFDRSLSVLIINVTAPCIILSSVMGDTLPGREEILPVLILGTCTLVFMLIVGIICAKLLRSSEEGIYSFMFAFGNINFIGLPVTSALFGRRDFLHLGTDNSI